MIIVTAYREIPGLLQRQCTNEGGEESTSEPSPLVGSRGS